MVHPSSNDEIRVKELSFMRSLNNGEGISRVGSLPPFKVWGDEFSVESEGRLRVHFQMSQNFDECILKFPEIINIVKKEVGDDITLDLNLLYGYDVIDGHFREEKPIFNQFERAFKFARSQMFDKHTNKQTLCDLLISLGVDEERIESLLQIAENHDLNDLSMVTNETYSGCVMDFELEFGDENRKKAYLKVTPNKAALEREYQFLTDAWKNPLLRVITPKPFEFINPKKYSCAALVTLGVENDNIHSIEDIYQYFTLREKAYQSVAKNLGIPKKMLVNDVNVHDMFNRALLHAEMKQYTNDPRYETSLFSLFHQKEIIQERLAFAKDGLQKHSLLNLITGYEKVVKRVSEYAKDKGTTIIHGDAKPENVWISPLSTRPLGDASHACIANEIFDLGRMEHVNPAPYVTLYAHFRSFIESEKSDGLRVYSTRPKDIRQLQEKVLDVSFVNALRYGSWKSAKNINDTNRYIELANRYRSFIKQ